MAEVEAKDVDELDEEEDEEPEETEEEKQIRYFAACTAGRWEEVSELLQDDVTSDEPDERGWTGIHWAALLGHDGVVAEIIEHADDDLNKFKLDAVRSAKNKNTSQAYFHYSTKPMNSPLHWAIYKGHFSIVCRLLLANFSYEVVDTDGNTPLHLACSTGNNKISELLLAKGADPRRQNKLGNAVPQVCPNANLRSLLDKAEEAWAKEPSFLCMLSHKFFPIEGGFVNDTLQLDQEGYSHPRSVPVRYSKDCAVLLKNTEAMLRDAMEEDDIEALSKALMTSAEVGVDKRLMRDGNGVLSKLKARTVLKDEMNKMSAKRPLAYRHDMNALIHAVTDAKRTGVDEMDVHPAEVLLRIAKAEFNVRDQTAQCEPIGPYRNGPTEGEDLPDERDPEGKRFANDDDKSDVGKLDSAIDYIKSELEAAPELDSPPDALALMEKALKIQKLLHVEMELNGSTQLPQESEGDEEQPDGTKTNYTHSDGSVAKTKLTSLQSRYARLEKAIQEATEVEPLPGADEVLIERVKTFASELNEELKVAQEEEEERLRKEEAARIKAERKKKKKKK